MSYWRLVPLLRLGESLTSFVNNIVGWHRLLLEMLCVFIPDIWSGSWKRLNLGHNLIIMLIGRLLILSSNLVSIAEIVSVEFININNRSTGSSTKCCKLTSLLVTDWLILLSALHLVLLLLLLHFKVLIRILKWLDELWGFLRRDSTKIRSRDALATTCWVSRLVFW